MPEMRAAIVDWGGVLTQPIRDTIRAWIAADQIDWDTYVAVVRPWLSDAYDQLGAAATGNGVDSRDRRDGRDSGDGRDSRDGRGGRGSQGGRDRRNGRNGAVNPVHALERGECTVAEFERMLAERLVTTTGAKVRADGLLTRMLSATRPDLQMYQVIRDLRGRGIRTALLSNSWGAAMYPWQDFPELFDAVVISGEVGMRKPEQRIFLHTAALLSITPAECVFVDDLEGNVTAAIGCGMTGVHHTNPAGTVARLTELFAAR